jgi:quinol monooxygenase YgiN
MIVQSIHFTFSMEDADKAEALLRELQAASRKEAGVIDFQVGRSLEKPNVFALWEQYTNQAAIDAHLETDHFNKLVINGVRLMARERSFEKVSPI